MSSRHSAEARGKQFWIFDFRRPFSLSRILFTTKLTKDTKNTKGFLNPVLFFVRFVIFVFFVVKE